MHSVSRETLADLPDNIAQRLRAFVDLLRRWNRRVNLVARSDEQFLWERHVLDSLQLAPLIPPGTMRAIDIGSGAGFPGLVLAVRTGIEWNLIEADQRKASFLREAARATEAPVHVHVARAERISLDPATLVTARGVAPLAALLPVAWRLLAPHGLCLFPKGRRVDSELTDARRQWHMHVERAPSRTAPDATILLISEIARAGPSR